MGKTPLDFARIKKKLVYAPNKGIKMATLENGTATVEESLTGKIRPVVAVVASV